MEQAVNTQGTSAAGKHFTPLESRLLAKLEEIVAADDAALAELNGLGMLPPQTATALTESARALIAEARH